MSEATTGPSTHPASASEAATTPGAHDWIPERPVGVQILCLLAAFVGGPALAWLVGQGIGPLSETAQTALYVPFVLVLFTGYGLWMARLHVIAMDAVGRALWKVLLMLILHKKLPDDVDQVMPSQEKVAAMLVRARRAGRSFFHMAIPIGGLAGGIALLVDTSSGGMVAMLVVGASCLVYGDVLGRLANAGYLPLMEG